MFHSSLYVGLNKILCGTLTYEDENKERRKSGIACRERFLSHPLGVGLLVSATYQLGQAGQRASLQRSQILQLMSRHASKLWARPNSSVTVHRLL